LERRLDILKTRSRFSIRRKRETVFLLEEKGKRFFY
jgi:hypothetical protein